MRVKKQSSDLDGWILFARLCFIILFLTGIFGCSEKNQISIKKGFDDDKLKKLVVAIADGKTNEIDELLSNGRDINVKVKNDVTPVMIAFYKQNKISFEYLLKKGADPNVRMDNGYTLLFQTLRAKDPFYLESTLKYGGNPNQRKPDIDDTDISLLWSAVFGEDPDKIRILIKYGADIKEHDVGYCTQFVGTCAAFNDYENVYTFLMAGASFSTNREPGSLIERLENRGVHPKDSEYIWRNKVVNFLRKRGIKVTPKKWKAEDQPSIINIQTNLNLFLEKGKTREKKVKDNSSKS